jgi:DNA-binding transcriptional MerR regulator
MKSQTPVVSMRDFICDNLLGYPTVKTGFQFSESIMLIGELAEISGMSKDGIRHYEQMGIISSSPRQAGSRCYRDYDASAITTIEMVHQAQQLGFSLKEISPLLKAHAGQEFTGLEIAGFLEERLKVIREKIDKLREVEDFILKKLNHYKEASL